MISFFFVCIVKMGEWEGGHRKWKKKSFIVKNPDRIVRHVSRKGAKFVR